ncbi:MAG: cobalt transport protein CbiN [Methanoregulaceae archaeon PtaB.Bin056]|jgi:cobalt/nickel transport protein|nr:MAG: cobalt transport protein CbiN [Methanoregulaceae archaeon PtaB.Bin056]
MDQKNLLYFGIIIALVIAVAAPFIASSNPDGLESAFFGVFGAKEVHGAELDEEAAGAAEEQVQEITGNTFSFDSPFPDYTIGGMEKAGEALIIAVGTLIVLGIAFGLGRALSRSD